MKTMSRVLDLLIRNKNKGVNGEVKSSKSLLTKTGYPELLHGCDFFFVLT